MYRYIASQGPKQNTAEHFWRCVLEKNISVVCMLTDLVEGRKIKCYQYWPEGIGARSQYGDIAVSMTAEENHGDFVYRAFSVVGAGQAARKVHQLQFTAWPDHGVPEHGDSMLAYLEEVQVRRGPQGITCWPLVARGRAPSPGRVVRLWPPLLTLCPLCGGA